MTSPPHILFAGNSSYANLGCEAIIRGSVRILRDAFGRESRFTSADFLLSCNATTEKRQQFLRSVV